MEHARYTFSSKFKGTVYTIDLVFRDTKAIIMGESASGKSLIYQLIDDEQNEGSLEAVCYNYKSISKLKQDMETGHLNYSGKLVVFDNADMLFDRVPNIVEEINLNVDNNYLIFARNAPGLDTSPNMIGTLNFEDNKYTIQYTYPEGMWS